MKIIIYIVLTMLSFVSANARETGEFIITSTPNEILGAQSVENNEYIKNDAKISWEVYVADNYNPERPAGIMVFAGAPNDVIPPVNWLSVMKDKNLIWVAPRKSGNGSSIYQQKLLAIMSIPLIEQRYSVDKSRIYISGVGRVAARTALEYPNIIKGGIFRGKNLWEDNADEKIKSALDNRYVFVSGSRSPIPRSTAYAYNKFRKAGVQKLEFIHLNGGGRINIRFSRSRLMKSIEFLDS